MAKKKTAAEPETSATTSEGPKPSVTKAAAVRAAVADGIDSPEEGVAYILQRFKVEMTKPQWSSYRSQEKARSKKGTRREPAEPMPRAPRASSNGHAVHTGNAAELARQVKALVAAHGAAAVHGMVDVFEG